MSWIQKLYETYENCQAGNTFDSSANEHLLLPVSHITQEAQIEITIDENSNFIRASVISKSESKTIIPCTEDSAGRSGQKPKPHPLCDKLQYVARDFNSFGGTVTKGFSKNPVEPYEWYVALLSNWCNSNYSNLKAKKVLEYVKKGTLISDLVENNILFLDSNGKLLKESKDMDGPEIFKVCPEKNQEIAFVRWRVEMPGDPQTKLYEDRELFDSWRAYYASTRTFKGLCYVTGEETFLADQHPKKIRNEGDQAKIISSNDTTGFTYRGRFQTAEQACSIGYDVTQKAHNALRWLISKQGYRNGDQIILAWSVEGHKIPELSILDSYGLLGEDSLPSTSEDFAHRLNLKIKGYRNEIGDSTGIVLMALDSGSPGRLSITYYRELSGSEYLKSLQNWYETCSWLMKKVPDKKDDPRSSTKLKNRPISFVGTPTPSDIIESAYGQRVNDKLRKFSMERILPCIIEGQRIPFDFVSLSIRRASNRIAMETLAWEKTISTACALYRKYHLKRGYSMSLEENRNSRDYLYGRLLAVAENIERWAMSESDQDRPTTAARLMNRFADHPFTTWRTIYLALTPYKAALGQKVNSRERLISEIGAMFAADDFKNDKRLSGEFLLGYYCQREELMKRIEKDKDEKVSGDEVD